jgi:hypothetical protein
MKVRQGRTDLTTATVDRTLEIDDSKTLPDYIPDFGNAEMPDLSVEETIQEANVTTKKIMRNCAEIYHECDKVEKKMAKCERVYYNSLGKLLKRRVVEDKFQIWKKDKAFLEKKVKINEELQKLRDEKNHKFENFDDYIKYHFFRSGSKA